jgi:hypothetical protein
MRWFAFDYAAGPGAGRLTRVHALQEKTMLNKIRITWIAAAALLALPAFAGGPLAQAAPAEQFDSQRIIREIVIDGGLIEADSDEAPATELRPSWVDQSNAPDRWHQHSW